MRPLRRMLIAAASLLLLPVLLLSEREPVSASPAALEYDFTKIGLFHNDWTTRQPEDHSFHLRLIGEQKDLPVVAGTNFNSRIQSSLAHTTRSFSFDVPETNLYVISFTGALSLDGGYGDILLEIADQPDQTITLFSDFDFLKTDNSSFKTETTGKAMLIPAGTHTITFGLRENPWGQGLCGCILTC